MPGGAKPATPSEGSGIEARVEAVVAGHAGDEARARAGLGHPEGAVRAAALGALARGGQLEVEMVTEGLGDADPGVRRRAAQLAARAGGAPNEGWASVVVLALVERLGDPVTLVAEMAAFALGELDAGAGTDERAAVVAALAVMAESHPDGLCREAAVAALGALADDAGLAAVLGALGDKPAVRRRAAVALAAFEDPSAEAGLRGCLDDRDWQVRQVAEDLLEVPPALRRPR